MKIKICPVGIMERFIKAQIIELKDGSTVQALLEELDIKEKSSIIAFVGGRPKAFDGCLFEGAEVKLISLISGG